MVFSWARYGFARGFSGCLLDAFFPDSNEWTQDRQAFQTGLADIDDFPWTFEGFMHHFPSQTRHDCLCSSLLSTVLCYVMLETPEVHVEYSMNIHAGCLTVALADLLIFTTIYIHPPVWLISCD